MDYYGLLGVARGASEKEVRQAYRRMARRHHPDVNGGDATAERRFKEINEAYEVLSNPETRRKYDLYGENWKHAGGTAHRGRTAAEDVFGWSSGNFRQTTTEFDLGDLLGGLFGGRSGRDRGRPSVEHAVDISLEEAFRGTTRVVQILARGSSEPQRLDVKLPAGVETGSAVHVSTDRFDVNVQVRVVPHPRFRRESENLHAEVHVPMVDLVLGGEVEVSTLTGKVVLRVPMKTQNGRVFRLAGRGMPSLKNKDRSGHLYIKVLATLPTELDTSELELFHQIRTIQEGRRSSS